MEGAVWSCVWDVCKYKCRYWLRLCLHFCACALRVQMKFIGLDNNIWNTGFLLFSWLVEEDTEDILHIPPSYTYVPHMCISSKVRRWPAVQFYDVQYLALGHLGSDGGQCTLPPLRAKDWTSDLSVAGWPRLPRGHPATQSGAGSKIAQL